MSSVNPDRILRELADLWVTTATPHQGEAPAETSGGVLRACSMTLIAIVDDEENSMDLGETIAMLMRGHPSRAIVVRIREGSDVLESRVFQQCWMPFGQRRQICCEQVEITASGDHLCDVPSIVGPLAVPDLPSVVWLRSKRVCQSGDYAVMLSIADKLIVDSAQMGAPAALATLISFLNAGRMVGDLAWTRLTELRQLVAQLLDNRKPHAIRIRFGGDSPAMEAQYLGAWLGGALQNAGIALENGTKVGDAVAAILVDDDLDVEVHPGGASYRSGSLNQTVKFKSGSDYDLLDEELGITVHDPVFEGVLRKVAA